MDELAWEPWDIESFERVSLFTCKQFHGFQLTWKIVLHSSQFALKLFVVEVRGIRITKTEY